MDDFAGRAEIPISSNGDPEPSQSQPFPQTELGRGHVQGHGNQEISNGRAKRVLDILLAIAMLIVFAPIIVTIAVWLSVFVRVPSVYRHERIGLHGQPFGCLKFTTMWPNSDGLLDRLLASDPEKRAEWEKKRKLSNDTRVIPGIGEFLRETSLDELPQLLNVLRGEMSIVGPRPVTAEELTYYGPFLHLYLSVRPGLTGPWQIGGRSDTSYDQRVKKDVWYVENASLVTDLKIIAWTAAFFVSGRLSGAR